MKRRSITVWKDVEIDVDATDFDTDYLLDELVSRVKLGFELKGGIRKILADFVRSQGFEVTEIPAAECSTAATFKSEADYKKWLVEARMKGDVAPPRISTPH